MWLLMCMLNFYLGICTLHRVTRLMILCLKGAAATIPTRHAQSVNFLQLAVGHGFAFVLPNKKSVGLEFNLFNNFNLSSKFPDYRGRIPDVDIRSNGLKMQLTFNF